MFEKEIEFIYKYNLNKIKDLGAFITYEQLIPANVHPALLQYLSAEIDFLIFEDRQKLLKDSIFDYSGEKIVEHFFEIGEEIKKTKKFSIDFLSKLLLHASSFNVNFIIRPKWSLLQFVFENENETSKTVTEIKQILNYLYYYPYLKRLLINFFDKKRILTITYSEFKELLDKIDKINYETNFEKILDSALSNMVEFIYTGESHNTKVSRQYVELFLADKGLRQFKMLLTEKFGVNNSERFEIAELKNAILEYKDIVDNTVVEDPFNIHVHDEREEIQEEIPDNIPEESPASDFISVNSEESVEDFPIEETDEIKEEEKKSFLEEHLEKLDKEVEDAKMQNDLPAMEESELEPLDFDEAPRVDEKNVDEVYELATEEEEVNSVLGNDETEDLPRLEISDENDNPFDDNILDRDDTVTDKESPEEIEFTDTEEAFVETGTKISFNPDELNSSEKREEDINDDEWPTKTTSSTDDDIHITMPKESEDEIDEDKDENAIAEELVDDEEIPEEPELFNEEDLQRDEEIAGMNQGNESQTSVDITGLLEDKRITKIIEVLFDYDMEEFATAIDEIAECNSEAEAHSTIDKIAEREFIDKSTKEIKLFKNIISDFLN